LRNDIPSSPELAATLPSRVLKRHLQHANQLVSSQLDEGQPANVATLNQLKINIQNFLHSPSLSDDIRRDATALVVGLQAYSLFSARQTTQGALAVSFPEVYMPRGNYLLDSVPIEHRNGPVWLNGEGTDIVTLTIGPGHTPGEVFSNNEGKMVLSSFSVENDSGRPLEFLSLQSGGSDALVLNVNVKWARQQLDRVTWVNDKFVNSTITYSGGPAALSGVRFDNCTFEFGEDAASQELLDTIKRHPDAPVTYYK
jgi:hypothetical protein